MRRNFDDLMGSKPLPAAFHLFAAEQSYDRWARTATGVVAESARARVSGRPAAVWLGPWANAAEVARATAALSARQNRLFLLVLYNIPNRDCGGFSRGGADCAEEYRAWVKSIAEAVQGRPGARGMFIVEPDALAHALGMGAERAAEKEQRLRLLVETCSILRHACGDSYVYLDAGHPRWHIAETVGAELRRLRAWEVADGVALNVSNSVSTQECAQYGILIGDTAKWELGFIVDTSRNGAGPPVAATGIDQWANPPTLRLGVEGNTAFAKENGYSERLHAVVWVKIPGESDGEANGGPAAGEFWKTGLGRLLGLECKSGFSF